MKVLRNSYSDKHIRDNMVKEIVAMLDMEEAGVPGVSRVRGWTSDWVGMTRRGIPDEPQQAILMEDAGR